MLGVLRQKDAGEMRSRAIAIPLRIGRFDEGCARIVAAIVGACSPDALFAHPGPHPHFAAVDLTTCRH